MIIGTLRYASRADGTAPLFADVCFEPTAMPKPLLIVMHGYGGQRLDVRLDIEQLAGRGVVAVAPDMRGRGDSGGRWDSGGLDVHDILDAARAAVSAYADEIDACNMNLVGYSGGGGNAISCMVRFPDLFRTCVSFFGISDYAGWYRSRGRPDCNEQMEAALGGPPEALPDVYDARNAIPGAGNARSARLHFFWDEEETMCPPGMVAAFIETYRQAGLSNAAVHVSRPGDALRWTHNYRGGNPDLNAADDLYLPDVLAAPSERCGLEPRGTFVVPGYLVTRRFEVWVADGQRGRVTVGYDLTDETPRVWVIDNPGQHPVRIETRSNLPEIADPRASSE